MNHLCNDQFFKNMLQNSNQHLPEVFNFAFFILYKLV